MNPEPLNGYDFFVCEAASKIMSQDENSQKCHDPLIKSPLTTKSAFDNWVSPEGSFQMCKVLAIELAPFNINANSISVGFMDVGQFDSPDKKPILDDILPRILLRRTGTPADIASMTAFLASDHASWITGADFRVDGGESAGRVPATDDELFT